MTTQALALHRFRPITTSIGIHVVLTIVLLVYKIVDSRRPVPGEVPGEVEVTFASFSLPEPQALQSEPSGSARSAAAGPVRASRLSGLRQSLAKSNFGTRLGSVVQQELDVSKERTQAADRLSTSMPTGRVEGSLGKYNFSWNQFAVSGTREKGGARFTEIDSNVLAQEFRSHQPQFMRCYERSMLLDSQITGLFSLEVTRNPNGSVSPVGNLDGVGTDTAKLKLSECIRSVAATLSIPPKLTGMTVKIALRLSR